MFKSLNSIVLAIVASTVMASGAMATPAQVFSKSVDDRAEEVKKEATRYTRYRAEFDTDMVALIKSDDGEVLHRRESISIEESRNYKQGIEDKYKPIFKNMAIFNIERAPVETLRSVGMAADLQYDKQPNAHWSFTARTLKDFTAMYGPAANAVNLGEGLCSDPAIASFSRYVYRGDRELLTYVDINQEGKTVEIHVATCAYTDGPDKGTTTIMNISPAMQAVNMGERFTKQERRVRQYSTIGKGEAN